MPDTTGDKVGVSTEDLNEVRTSLESSMDTKMSSMEAKIDKLAALIDSVITRGILTKEVEEVEDPSLVEANKAAVVGEDDLEKLKANSSSTKPKIGNGEYSSVPPFTFADPHINHPHINNVGDPSKFNAVDFERWKFEF